jgi:cytoskeletal protein CcmA (bactofilin family)
MRRLLSALTLSVLLICATPVLAVTLQSGENVKITSPIRDNAYLAGGQVSVDQPVMGDLFVAGGTVVVKSNVQQDIAAAGGTIFLEGTASGDLRVAGGNVFIRNQVQGDLIALGGSIVIAEDAIVRGDVIAAGGDITIQGTVEGDVLARGENIVVSSILKGNADLRGEHVTITGSIDGSSILVGKAITLEPSARLMQDVRYWLPKTAQPLAGEQIRGTVTLDPTLTIVSPDTVRRGGGIFAIFAGMSVYLLLSAALVILILLFLTKSFFLDTAKYLTKNPWMSLLYGFLYFAVTPITALLFFITIIGIPIAFLIGVMYAFSIVFAKPLTALVLARTLETSREKEWSNVKVFFVSIVLFIVLKATGLIPVVGWIVVMASVFFTFGALIVTKWAKFAKVR